MQNIISHLRFFIKSLNSQNKMLSWSLAATFLLLGFSFMSFDLVALLTGGTTSLLNVRINDGMRIDESYMYLAGVGKTILFDPYIKEHAADLTLRPTIPTLIFSAIYYICGSNLDLAIIVAHTIPPLFSCALIYLICMELSGSRALSVFGVLLAVGHFIYTPLTVLGSLYGKSLLGVVGSDLYVLKHLLGNYTPFGGVHSPTQFTRIFSPAITLPFLLLPILMIIRSSTPRIRGFLIALNLYVYPHHVIPLIFLELLFLIKNNGAHLKEVLLFFLLGTFPYILQHGIVIYSGHYSDIYSRVGQTHALSTLWFFVPLFGLLATASFLIWIYISKKRSSNFLFILGIFLSAVTVLLADAYTKFPQVHLVELRIFAFLAPIALIACIGMLPMKPSRVAGYLKVALIVLNIYLLVLILVSYIHSGWTHRLAYQDFPENGFSAELKLLPKGAVVLTDVQYEIPYISAESDKYSYLGYGIVSAAGNQELLERFVIASRIFNWSDKRLKENDWDELLPVSHWVYHHGAPPQDQIEKRFNEVIKGYENYDKCALIKIYQVDYIRFRDDPPKGIENCTKVISRHILEVTGS